MTRSSFALTLVAAGLGLALAGLLVWSGALSWFGRLPGDIRIERPRVRVFVPIASMLLISLLVTLIAAILRRLR